MMHELLSRNAFQTPDKTFLISESQSITNRRAFDIVQKAEAGFHSLGVRKGDRVLIFAPNSVEYVLAMFAAFKLGAIAALIDVSDPQSYRKNVSRLAPRLVVSTSHYLNDLKSWSPRGTKFISFNGELAFAHSWGDLLDSVRRPFRSALKETEPCHLCFTSGTTYKSKPVVLSHEPTVRATRCIAERLGLNADETNLGVTTLSSSHILVYAILPQMHQRATVSILEKWDASRAWKMIHDHEVRVVSGTAVRLSELADYAKDHGIDKRNVRLVISGGSAGLSRIREQWEHLGVQFVEAYGMSELGGAVALTFPKPLQSKAARPFQGIPAIGPPLPDKEVKIIDERGNDLPPGIPGEILVRGGFMCGYWKMRQETEKTTRGGWLHTSDIGLMDEVDNVFWLARKTDIIQTERGSIYPRIIEESLLKHPSVRQVCVVGLREGRYQTPVGFVTLFAREKVSEEELLRYCKSTVNRECWPSRIVIRTSFPMTRTGKVDKKQLK